ncbi:hypothetical protein [Alicyclobacillus sp. SO9]|uniref:hypothetical protein n=1 Tax=Alicyclobacillus sp. SO9 TaxID=2665646 RepID=UPI0018E72FFB|nr:hypothetical protein [Alicyclobacillus sp. SO9]QQE77182.1 hypothetical protein GI364_14530 [Alicyclobacillus sp. SO9]
MKTLTISNQYLNPVCLPGMGRSIELSGLDESELIDIRHAYTSGQLYIQFTEEPDEPHRVINLWANPHSPQITLFIK